MPGPVDLNEVQEEVRATLVRYLPFGLEGVAQAQTDGVRQVLERHLDARSRVPVPDSEREALRQAREVALSHRPGVGEDRCPVCREAPSSSRGAAFPCPVWRCAISLGAVTDADVGGAHR